MWEGKPRIRRIMNFLKKKTVLRRKMSTFIINNSFTSSESVIDARIGYVVVYIGIFIIIFFCSTVKRRRGATSPAEFTASVVLVFLLVRINAKFYFCPGKYICDGRIRHTTHAGNTENKTNNYSPSRSVPNTEQ